MRANAAMGAKWMGGRLFRGAQDLARKNPLRWENTTPNSPKHASPGHDGPMTFEDCARHMELHSKEGDQTPIIGPWPCACQAVAQRQAQRPATEWLGAAAQTQTCNLCRLRAVRLVGSDEPLMLFNSRQTAAAWVRNRQGQADLREQVARMFLSQKAGGRGRDEQELGSKLLTYESGHFNGASGAQSCIVEAAQAFVQVWQRRMFLLTRPDALHL
jgi:hypothetical protein